jgi:acyl-CoA dehydrogenase
MERKPRGGGRRLARLEEERTMAMDDDSFQQVLETVTRFARERLIPAEGEVEELDDIPEDIVRDMRDLGLFGLSIPEEYGGLELNVSQESRVVEALTYAAMSFRSLVGTNVGIGAQGIVMEGTEAQKQQYLPGLATGELIASFALTEPDHGSDASHIRTAARRDGDDYIINGTKRYITNAVRANVFTLFARTNPDDKGASGVSAFLLPADTPGITIATPDRKMGQKGTKTSDVILEDVRVPADFIVGGPDNAGRGFRTAMKVLDRGRIHVSSMAVGTAQRMLDALGQA